MTRSEGDEIAAMVLALVTDIAQSKPQFWESTDLWVDEDVHHIVCRPRRGRRS